MDVMYWDVSNCPTHFCSVFKVLQAILRASEYQLEACTLLLSPRWLQWHTTFWCLWFTEADLQAASGCSILCPASPAPPSGSPTTVAEAQPTQWMWQAHQLKLSCTVISYRSLGQGCHKSWYTSSTTQPHSASLLCAVPIPKSQLVNLLLASWEVLFFITFPSALSI